MRKHYELFDLLNIKYQREFYFILQFTPNNHTIPPFQTFIKIDMQYHPSVVFVVI